MYLQDNRIVVTLDAGGTKFVFGAIKGGKYIIEPLIYPAYSDNLELCLNTIIDGFSEVLKKLETSPVAISFAFPGPADYANGVIGGNLPNFPCFKDPVALGPLLEKHFGIPVFINNDANLYTYGEAIAGILPWLNSYLERIGSTKQYRNLIGITIGTGLGCGIVSNEKILFGDNGFGGGLWCLRNYSHPDMVIEESISIRGIKKVYKEFSNDDRNLEPKDIFDIAEGNLEGNTEAAIKTFQEFGKNLGDALSTLVTLFDGAVVLGGGITKAEKYFMPSILEAMRMKLSLSNGKSFLRTQSNLVYIPDDNALKQLTTVNNMAIPIYRSYDYANYEYMKRTPIMISQLGSKKATALGAYYYALDNIFQKDVTIEDIL